MNPPARWCRTTQWPIPDFYARCPNCGLFVEDRLHPRWPGLPDLSYAPVDLDDQYDLSVGDQGPAAAG